MIIQVTSGYEGGYISITPFPATDCVNGGNISFWFDDTSTFDDNCIAENPVSGKASVVARIDNIDEWFDVLFGEHCGLVSMGVKNNAYLCVEINWVKQNFVKAKNLHEKRCRKEFIGLIFKPAIKFVWFFLDFGVLHKGE